MKDSVKNAVFIGKIGEDNNKYPVIRLNMEDKPLFEKNGTEYAILILGSVNRKKTVRDSMRIITNADF